MNVKNAQEAVELTAKESIQASIAHTFAVGGIILNNSTGEVIHSAHNNVLRTCQNRSFFLPYDPTAHGERQLVDWYYANKAEKNLPPTHELTVVTSLDPCAMCAGALLLSGFNVGVAASDPFAGINYDQSFDFPSVPDRWRPIAKQRFGYYGVREPVSKVYEGGASVIFAGQSITPETYLLVDTIFESSVNDIRQISDSNGRDPKDMKDPYHLQVHSPIRQALLQADCHAFALKLDDFRFPDRHLFDLLVNIAMDARRSGSRFNAVAFIDPFGNVLTALGGREDISPIRSAFMEVTRKYANVRWTLLNSSEEATRKLAEVSLTHPRYGTFVYLFAPNPKEPESLLNLGAYGSTMEGPVPRIFPANLQYYALQSDNSHETVARMATRLPPFYTTDVQVSPMQVPIASLIDSVAGLSELFASKETSSS